MENLLNMMIHCHTKRTNSVREADRKIEQSIAYMKQHLDAPLHVGTLAALVSISPSHYFALFKRRTGTAPIDYFIRLRMQQACHLLDATSMSVKEVAATLGYEDPYYFSRMFKSVNEMAPSDYRALRRDTQRQSNESLEVLEAASA
jgi:transcriptional regulator GlxA family with amidase domain